MSISKCLFNSKLPKKESKSEVLEKGKTILIAESINSVDNLERLGMSAEDAIKTWSSFERANNRNKFNFSNEKKIDTLVSMLLNKVSLEILQKMNI